MKQGEYKKALEQFRDKWVWIHGAGSKFGREFTETIISLGAKVFLSDTRTASLKELAEAHPSSTRLFDFDPCNTQFREFILEQLGEADFRLNYLIDLSSHSLENANSEEDALALGIHFLESNFLSQLKLVQGVFTLRADDFHYLYISDSLSKSWPELYSTILALRHQFLENMLPSQHRFHICTQENLKQLQDEDAIQQLIDKSLACFTKGEPLYQDQEAKDFLKSASVDGKQWLMEAVESSTNADEAIASIAVQMPPPPPLSSSEDTDPQIQIPKLTDTSPPPSPSYLPKEDSGEDDFDNPFADNAFPELRNLKKNYDQSA